MGFRINTNIDALSAHASATANNRALSSSLGRLNSGLRIQSAADDASGLAIADSLRSQASSLTQAISNGNDAIGIIQTADKAMDEQLKILDTIKAKSVQAAQDGQTSETRKAIQADISRLMEELDMIGNTTSFNGQKLLNGSFTNKEFQVGAYSNETVKASIGPTTSDKIGLTRFETGITITNAGNINIKFINVDGVNDLTIATQTDVADAVDAINAVSDKTGVKATLNAQTVGSVAIAGGNTGSAFAINGVLIGKVDFQANDANGALRAAINKVKDQTGVEASVDESGKLVLTNRSGRGGIQIVSSLTAGGVGAGKATNLGRVSLVKLGGADIVLSATGIGFSTTNTAEATVSLRQMDGKITSNMASAMGFFANSTMGKSQTAGVTTLRGAMAMMNVAEAAQKALDQVRSDLGSVQKQLEATVNNITVTQVNVKSAESNIRDVDFAAESATFSKHNILAQSGTYAMSQANATAQNVMRLLQ